MVSACIDNGLASKYSVCGQRGKKSFHDLPVYKVLIRTYWMPSDSLFLQFYFQPVLGRKMLAMFKRLVPYGSVRLHYIKGQPWQEYSTKTVLTVWAKRTAFSTFIFITVSEYNIDMVDSITLVVCSCRVRSSKLPWFFARRHTKANNGLFEACSR